MPSLLTGGYEGQSSVSHGAPNTAVYRPVEIVDTSKGLQSLAGAVVDVVQKENTRRDQIDLMQYDQKLSELDQRKLLGDEQTPGALRQLGVNAAGITKKTQAEWDKEAASFAPKLRNPDNQLRAENLRNVRREDLSTRLTNHEYEQGKQADEQVTNAALDTYANEAAMAGNDVKVREAALARGRNAFASWATRNGLPPTVAALKLGQYESKTLAGIAENMMTDDPLAAQTFIDSEPRILFEDRANLNKTLRPFVDDGKQETMADDILRAGAGALSAPSADAPKAVSTNVAVIQSDYRTLANQYGFEISSMQRTPKEQATLVRDGKTKAVNSQHVSGTACDFSVKGKSKAECEALIADLKAHGYQVVDERAHGGTGPHIHAELPPGHLPSPAAPQTKAEALDAASHIANKRDRTAVMTKIRQRYEVIDAQKQDADRSMMESIYTTVWEAKDTGLPLRKVLASIPGGYEYAVANNHAGTLTETLMPNKESNTTSLSQVGQIQQKFYEAANGDKVAQNFVNRFNPFDVSKYALTNEQRHTLADQRLALAKHDPQAIADITTTGKVVQETMFNTFGTLEHPVGSPEDDQYNQFQASLTQSIQAFKAQNKGAAPTQEQVQRMADVLVLQTHSGARVFEDASGGTKAVDVPPDQDALIQQAFPNYTPEQRRVVYFRAVTAKAVTP